jgi:uncharacterized protein YjiS (DUF1127 family)
MNTMSSAHTAPQDMIGQSWIRDLGATLHRWCVAYLTWRIERAAIAQLRSMSDRQLTDIGISRSEIMSAVKGGAESNRAFCFHRPNTR